MNGYDPILQYIGRSDNYPEPNDWLEQLQQTRKETSQHLEYAQQQMKETHN